MIVADPGYLLGGTEKAMGRCVTEVFMNRTLLSARALQDLHDGLFDMLRLK